MASNVKYRHKIRMMYDYEGTLKEFTKDCITNLVINKDYDKFNLPIMYLKISLDRNFIDYMIRNKDNKYITMYIDKYLYDDKLQIATSYIKEQFIYFMDDNLNDNDKIDYNEHNKDGTNQRLITIGLMKLDNINNNKRTISGICNKTSLEELLLSQLTHMKLLMEPLTRNPEINNISIPLKSTITSFIEHLNEHYTIYPTRYRFFIGYDKTYLLSSSGKGIPSIDEDYNKIIIDVSDATTNNSHIEGMTIDKTSGSYIIHIDNTDISMYQNKLTTTNINNIIGVDYKGNTTEVQLSASTEMDNKKKSRIVRTNNLSKIEQMKKDVELNSTIVNIIKAEIDSSLLTLNKEYYIRNHPDNRINGKYLLSSVKEVYVRKDDNFLCSTVISMRKIS